jgi:hypothetical protein
VSPLDREMKRLRHSWRRGGLPGFVTTPPVPSVPAPRPQPGAEEVMERLVLPADRPADPWDTGQLAALYPNAGEGWRAAR